MAAAEPPGMKVSDLVSGVVRLIYNCRTTVHNGKPQEFIFGNNRFLDFGPPPFQVPPPAADGSCFLMEIAVGDVPIEVWKLIRDPHQKKTPDEGQDFVIIHNIYSYLVTSEEYAETRSKRQRWGPISFRVIQHDPVDAYSETWKKVVFALADAKLSFECHKNLLWKSEAQNAPSSSRSSVERGPPGVHSGSHDVPCNITPSIAVPVGSAGRASSMHSSHCGSYSQQRATSLAATLNAGSNAQPLVGSLSAFSKTFGTSPSSFVGMKRASPPVPAENPRLGRLYAVVAPLPQIDPNEVDDCEDLVVVASQAAKNLPTGEVIDAVAAAQRVKEDVWHSRHASDAY